MCHGAKLGKPLRSFTNRAIQAGPGTAGIIRRLGNVAIAKNPKGVGYAPAMPPDRTRIVHANRRASRRRIEPVGSDFEAGNPLPHLQRAGMLETPVLQAFRWRPPEIVAKTVDEVSSRFNKLQHPIFVSHC
jgi:hypothetical protein